MSRLLKKKMEGKGAEFSFFWIILTKIYSRSGEWITHKIFTNKEELKGRSGLVNSKQERWQVVKPKA